MDSEVKDRDQYTSQNDSHDDWENTCWVGGDDEGEAKSEE
jgi:hypothetical protein